MKKVSKTNQKVKNTSSGRPRPQEFMAIMERLNLIDQEIKKETELFEIKVKSLELEKEYLWRNVAGKM